MRKCFTWKKPGTVHSAWRIQDPGPVQGQMEVLLLTHLSSFFGAMCCLSQSVENFFKLQREWSKAKVFWRLDVIRESFLNGNTMLSCLVTVLLVFHEILDALSNSTLRWFNWASVTVIYQILVSGISLQLYLSSALLDCIHFWSELRPSLPFLLCLISAFISCFSHPTLPLCGSRWLNLYPSHNLAFILLYLVQLTMVIMSVWQSEILSRVSPFLFGAESFLSCRNIHVYTRNVFLSAG